MAKSRTICMNWIALPSVLRRSSRYPESGAAGGTEGVRERGRTGGRERRTRESESE